MNKLEEKIKEILQEHITFGYADEQFLYDQKGLLEELSTLIQQERREAVEEFVEWLNAKDFLFRDNMIMKLYKEYLNSIGSAESDDTPEVNGDKAMRIIESLAEMKQNALDIKNTPSSISSIKKEFKEFMLPRWWVDKEGKELPRELKRTGEEIFDFFLPYLKDSGKEGK